jgi:putative lipoic acid-binding regulatory protein
MEKNQQIHKIQPETALTFPCDMPMKVIGLNISEFENTIFEIIERRDLRIAKEDVTSILSRNETYRSMSFHFFAENREQVDDLYRELTSNQYVKWVL